MLTAVTPPDPDILFREQGPLGRITLNRPQVLNALTLPMYTALLRQLEIWAASETVETVAIDAVPGRAFCAGGDVRDVSRWARVGDLRAMVVFAMEYRMNAVIKRYPKPYVALVDGIVMGGGVGISVNGRYRVASENAVLAMPETAIGFFPDVGGSYFLSRCSGEIGMYLGLTGARLKAADMIYAGLATHFIPQARFAEVLVRLSRSEEPGGVLTACSGDPGPAPLEARRGAIDRAFSAPSVEAIFEALKVEGEWGAETAAVLAARSPTSLKLVYRQLREGRTRTFEACLKMEYGLAAHVMQEHDFHEGVRAVLIDKDQNPDWQPARLAEIRDETIDAYFAPLGDTPEF